MIKTWVLASSALVVAAVTLLRRWRRRHSNGAVIEGQSVSDEWLSHVRGQPDERW